MTGNAYRAGTSKAFHGSADFPDGTSDDSQVANVAWFGANSGSQTHPVGSKAANGFGLHDMSGNVWEWTNDWYGGYDAGPQTNPSGPGPLRSDFIVLRGGSWANDTNGVRSSVRGWGGIGAALIGFRAARNP